MMSRTRGPALPGGWPPGHWQAGAARPGGRTEFELFILLSRLSDGSCRQWRARVPYPASRA